MQYGPPIPFESFETKAVVEDADVFVVTGYASVFGNRDLGGDIVVEGAFKKSLAEHGLPALLFNHKMNDPPLGTIVDAAEHKRGLWIKAELPKDDTFVSGRIIPQLKKRGLKGMSIGYQVLEKEQRSDARYLKQIRLYEVSVVNTPMNPLAAVESIKGFDLSRLDATLEAAAEEMQRLARLVRGG
jgi:uncharacterized protein